MNNKITYHREGDYFIPDLCLPKQPNGHIGKYGRLRLNYLNIIKQSSQKRQSYHKRIVRKKSIIIPPFTSYYQIDRIGPFLDSFVPNKLLLPLSESSPNCLTSLINTKVISCSRQLRSSSVTSN